MQPVRAPLALALLLAAASCVPAATAPPRAVSPLSIDLPELAAARPAPLAAIAPLPLAQGPNLAAQPFAFRAAAGSDALRSLDCLAQAVYYEAGAESEDGQRAVAQVVLNRVRHPGYPASVCGVVYQGPMRADGGCQFTFTCDGSLARAPSAAGWLRARRIAADALAGRVYAPVGLATHYHADYVLPLWAFTLDRVTMIGRHIFYRWPGAAGTPAAFAQAYAGREPLPTPRLIIRTAARPAVPVPALPAVATPPPETRYTALMPLSRVRPEYQNSGTPLAALR